MLTGPQALPLALASNCTPSQIARPAWHIHSCWPLTRMMSWGRWSWPGLTAGGRHCCVAIRCTTHCCRCPDLAGRAAGGGGAEVGRCLVVSPHVITRRTTKCLPTPPHATPARIPFSSFEALPWSDACSVHNPTLQHSHCQVTGAAVRLIESSGARCIAEWSPPEGRTINLAASSPSQVLLSTGGGALTYLEVQEGGLVVRGTATLAAEVACLDITPTTGWGPQWTCWWEQQLMTGGACKM
jgi:hypothetical protein